MTGFAATEAQVGSHRLVWEIRSVNHRFLELSFRLPEEIRSLEPQLRRLAGEALKRGKVDCTLKLSATGVDQGNATLNPERLQALRTIEKNVRAAWPEAQGLSVAEILRWPGVIDDEGARTTELAGPALEAFAEALASLRSARAREGSRLSEMLADRLGSIDSLMTAIDEQLLEAAPRYRDKLLERLERLDVDANPERLEQEVALIAQRADVTEEADRLRSHVSEIRDVLSKADPIGRRLDFLIQELNREANTLASKVQDEELARRAVDLKVLIEQMREQVQNIE